ncbi:MAG: hypothetical protein P4L90_25520 [Rhodopila sp.]|nr:hypothetical protein [Rhodopila sp.]
MTEQIARMKGSIAVLEGQIARQRADLAHVEATLRMFKPDYDGKTVEADRQSRTV